MVNLKGLRSYCQDCGACGLLERGGQQDEGLAEMISRELLRSLAETGSETADAPTMPLGVSNRHIHLRRETFKTLFGNHAEMEQERELYQPGEFASRHSCMIIGPRMRSISGARILGPYREYDQVEISATDAVKLGINAPTRESGQLADAAAVSLAGPAGTVHLPHAAIVAARHVHMSAADAERLALAAGDLIRVRLNGGRSTVFENVLVRVGDKFRMQLHLDTDEANAARTVCDSQAQFLGKMEDRDEIRQN